MSYLGVDLSSLLSHFLKMSCFLSIFLGLKKHASKETQFISEMG
jgi:hypothetical protein